MPKTPRTIPVHVLADERVHLAPAYLGRLRQGRLKTLCGLLAVTALSPFVLAEPARRRCETCFGGDKPAAKPGRRKPAEAALLNRKVGKREDGGRNRTQGEKRENAKRQTHDR